MKRLLLSILIGSSALFSAEANAGTGGPDTYGYTYIDSNEPNGPAFNWIEIATPEGGTGTLRTAVQCDDCHEPNIPLGFEFPFYGSMLDTITIASNGTIYFQDVYLGLSNSCIPGTPGYTMNQYRFIAHLWDDLDPSSQGGIYTKAFPNYFVIEYYNVVPCCGAGDGDSWQVILFKNGNIIMQYKELSNIGLNGGHTVGIQNDPTTGLQYLCDATGTALASGRAIRFTPPAFTVCSTVSQNILPATAGFCAGTSVAIPVSGSAIAQSWSTGATTSSISVNTAGTYTIAVTDTNSCTLRDTITVSVLATPSVVLGTDVIQCGGNVTLDAGNAGSGFLWSNAETTQMVSVNTTGTYSVVVTDAVTMCEGKDTISVTINPVPVVALGADVIQCGGSVTLDAGNAGSTFLWSDASATQTISVSSSGSYSVIVTEPVNSCSGKDTVNVTINALPVVTLSLAMDTMCSNYAAVTLTGGSPAGGVYSGTGVSNDMFDPAVAGLGDHTISYTYVDGNNCSATTTQVLNVDVCTSVNSADGSAINIYPNPSEGELFVSSGSASLIQVYNSVGQMIYSQSDAKGLVRINLEEQEAGIYFVKISSGNSVSVEKMIIK